jgi:hypothetical protein
MIRDRQMQAGQAVGGVVDSVLRNQRSSMFVSVYRARLH